MSGPTTSGPPTRGGDETSAGADGADAPVGPDPQEAAPLFRVVKGAPTTEELAALVAVLAARQASGAAADATPSVRRSGWSARDRELRGIHRHGPGGWRGTVLPR